MDMYELILLRFSQFLEFRKSGNLKKSLLHKIYSEEVVIPVKKDLLRLQTIANCSDHDSLKLVEISSRTNSYAFVVKSRENRAKVYINKGYMGFGLLNNDMVVGEVWYIPWVSGEACLHPLAKLIGIKLQQQETYMFDLFVDPTQRGKSITTYFMSSVLKELKLRGYRNVYGYFAVDNLPALWIHRVLGYEELERYIISRWFFRESAVAVTMRNAAPN